MRILLIVNDIHFKGGGEKVASNIASWYAEKGKQTYILSMEKKQEKSIFPISNKVNVDYLGVKNTKLISKLIVFFRLFKYLKKNQFDFILGIGTYANVLLGFLHFCCGEKIGCEHNSFDSVSLFWKVLRRLSYPRLDSTVILTKEDFCKMKQISSKVYVIPNCISIPPQKALLNNKNILAVGKIYPQKGFDIMIEVFNLFAKKNTDWTLTIVGDGKDKQKIITLIKKYNLTNRVFIMKPTNNIEKYYLDTSLYLMTSRFEGLPMVLLEAQSYGIPIISFDCKTGPKEIVIHNRNGYLIREGDIENMVEYLHKYVNDYKLRMNLSKNARIDAKRFIPEEIYKLWDNLFKEKL